MRRNQRKPTALKILQGTFRPDRAPKNEPKPEPKIPPCPAHLDAIARHEWHVLSQLLHPLGLLTLLDRGALEMYCDSYSRWVRATAAVRESGEVVTLKGSTGQTRIFPNPWRRIADTAFEQMNRMLSEFGLTPASRSRISVKKLVEPADDDDEEFFSRRTPPA